METNNISQSAQLHSSWVNWIAENCNRGVDPEQICSILQERGMSRGESLALVSRYSPSISPISRMLADLQKQRTEVARRKSIAADDFFEFFYEENRPVLIEKFAEGWPALRQWSPDHFADRLGDEPIDICRGRDRSQNCDENFRALGQRQKLKHFLAEIEQGLTGNDAYVIANNRLMERDAFFQLTGDVCLDEAMFDMSRLRGQTSLWIGPSGTVTSLHHDQNNIMFTQIYGKKHFKLISPLQAEMQRAARNFYSEVDPENPDLDRFPWWEGITVQEVTVEPGQALFLPIGWWHHVRSLSTSISISFLNFQRPNDFKWFRPWESSPH